jgi:hypothetical protein
MKGCQFLFSCWTSGYGEHLSDQAGTFEKLPGALCNVQRGRMRIRGDLKRAVTHLNDGLNASVMGKKAFIENEASTRGKHHVILPLKVLEQQAM